MARPTLGPNDEALIKRLIDIKPEIDTSSKNYTATIKKMIKQSEEVAQFFNDDDLMRSTSAKAFIKEMHQFERAIIESYRVVKTGLPDKFVAGMNIGNTTEAVLLYGMGLTHEFRHDYWKPGYFGGDIDIIEDGHPIKGVQVKHVGGELRIDFSTAESELRKQVKRHGKALDPDLIDLGLAGLLSGKDFTAPKTMSKNERKIAIAERYAEILAATEYIMFRASNSNYFFVTVKVSELGKFVADNLSRFGLKGAKSDYATAIIFRGFENQDLWRIGQQSNFLAIHFPMPSYFYHTRGVIRKGQTAPNPPPSGYGVGEIQKYNDHIAGRAADFEMVHNSFFGSYGKVKAKY